MQNGVKKYNLRVHLNIFFKSLLYNSRYPNLTNASYVQSSILLETAGFTCFDC